MKTRITIQTDWLYLAGFTLLPDTIQFVNCLFQVCIEFPAYPSLFRFIRCTFILIATLLIISLSLINTNSLILPLILPLFVHPRRYSHFEGLRITVMHCRGTITGMRVALRLVYSPLMEGENEREINKER